MRILVRVNIRGLVYVKMCVCVRVRKCVGSHVCPHSLPWALQVAVTLPGAPLAKEPWG